MATPASVDDYLVCRGMTKTYGHKTILDALNLNLQRGETLALMGRSGCGKSTLLKAIAGLEPLDAGEAELEGQVYIQRGTRKYRQQTVSSSIGIVFQQYKLFGNMRCAENIGLALRKVKGVGRISARQTIDETARLLGIADVLERYPDEVSGGQAQRVAIARALVLQPKVLLLDEVTSALDPESVIEVMDALGRLKHIEGSSTSMIVVTHHVGFASKFASRIGFIDAGKVVETHSAERFMKDCQSESARTFIKSMGRIS